MEEREEKGTLLDILTCLLALVVFIVGIIYIFVLDKEGKRL